MMRCYGFCTGSVLRAWQPTTPRRKMLCDVRRAQLGTCRAYKTAEASFISPDARTTTRAGTVADHERRLGPDMHQAEQVQRDERFMAMALEEADKVSRISVLLVVGVSLRVLEVAVFDDAGGGPTHGRRCDQSVMARPSSLHRIVTYCVIFMMEMTVVHDCSRACSAAPDSKNAQVSTSPPPSLTIKAFALGEVPVGAVVVSASGAVLGRAHNQVEGSQDPTAHAEVLAVRRAAAATQSWRLGGATLYVTLEPCAMCAGAALNARLEAVVYGARSPLLGAHGSWIPLLPGAHGAAAGQPPPPHALHPSMHVRSGVLTDECQSLMLRFFRKRRGEGTRSQARGDAAGPP